MALIHCPLCDASISDQARACPKCGAVVAPNYSANPIKPNRKVSRGLICIIALSAIVIVILSILLYFKTADSNKATAYTSQGRHAYTSIPKTGTAGALAKAESYLKSSAFSYTGLIDQLEYHGFSNYEATYAANNCGADWNAQALRKAKSYLSSSAFSYTGLIDQLEYSGFTSSQAQYGADQCGANWKEQAVKKAKSYLKSSSNWTSARLKSQLEYSGFTSSEASYGVSNCGMNW